MELRNARSSPPSEMGSPVEVAVILARPKQNVLAKTASTSVNVNYRFGGSRNALATASGERQESSAGKNYSRQSGTGDRTRHSTGGRTHHSGQASAKLLCASGPRIRITRDVDARINR